MTQFPVTEVPDDSAVASVIARIIGLIGIVLVGPSSAAAPLGELLRQQQNIIRRPTLIPLTDTLEMHRRELIADPVFRDLMQRGGFSETAIGVYEELEKSILAVGELLALWRRDEIVDSELTEGLKRLGWEGQAVEQLKVLAFDVPSGQDVIRFTVREVFNPELRAALQLDSDFPVAALDAFKAAGLDEDRARNEWAAHWQLPSTSLAFSMFHRALIDEDQLRIILRAQDVMPVFVEPIIAAAFNPLTRVDIRRMHAVGLLDEEQLIRRYQDIGFSPENAGLMADFTILFNEAPDEEQAKEARDLTRSQITSFVKAGLFGPEEAINALVDIGFDLGTAETIISLEALKVATRQRDAEIKVIRNRFENGTISFNQAVEELGTLDLTAVERDLILTELEAERLSNIRIPTRGELDAFFREDLIAKPQYLDGLEALGIQDPWRERFAQLIAAEFEEVAKEPKKLSRSVLLRVFRAGLLTIEQVETRLITLGFSTEDAGLIIQLETLARPEEERELPRTLITKLMVKDIFTEDEARTRLLGIGFSAEDTDDIITLALQKDKEDADE